MRYQIPNAQLSKFKKKHAKICDEFKYSSDLFNKARFNVGIMPLVVPWLWRYWLKNNEVPTDGELVKLLRKEPGFSVSGNRTRFSDKEIFVARCYQLRLGFCRELDLAIRLVEKNPKCEIWRDDELDIGKGRSDLIYKNNGTETHIAVCHKGSTSSRYASYRKEDKMASVVIEVIADYRVNDIDLVSDESIRTICELN